ncbi:MAG: hypothetical protein IPN74_06965 [Haliscomenobacter sp.]|nr:hypothetical protein [Haliscomenobacter sp.]
MQNSQLTHIFRSLNKKETRELRKWLLSPFHNQREDVLQLFDYFQEKDYLNNDPKLKKELVFQKIFPGEAYDDARMRQTIHFLQKCTEDFLAYKEFQEEPTRRELLLAEGYRRRNLDRLFEKALKGLNDNQRQSRVKNEEFLQANILIQSLEYKYISEKKRTPDTNLQTYSDALDLYFIAGKLRLASLITAVQKIYTQDIRVGLLEEALHYVESNGLPELPAIRVYYFIYKSLSDPANEHFFFSLKEAIFQYDHYFSPEEQRDILLLAVNYCIAKMNTGVTRFIVEAFDLYKRGN